MSHYLINTCHLCGVKWQGTQYHSCSDVGVTQERQAWEKERSLLQDDNEALREQVAIFERQGARDCLEYAAKLERENALLLAIAVAADMIPVLGVETAGRSVARALAAWEKWKGEK